MSNDAEDVLEQAAAWRAQGHAMALATVIETWGSSPRPAGSQLAVNERGAFVGSVSGGCIEAAVVRAALDTMAGGLARRLAFGVSHEDAWEVGLACGGRVEVLVQPLPGGARSDLLERLLRARAAKRAVVLATDLGTFEARLIEPFDTEPPEPDAVLYAAARRAAAQDRSQRVQTDAGEVFLRVWNAPLRMLIVGAVHVAQPLAQFARANGFEVIVIDPRGAFATEARFPGIALRCGFPDEVLAELAPDRRSAVVTLSHDPRFDEPALEAALRAGAFYVGALGSRKTHAARLERLAARGIEAEALARIHGPVGLDIGAISAAEIATSIMAEVIADLRKGARA
jgi:xanthine dehydrogenase accessory factor